MAWIVKNLWLIPALPILAAGLSALAGTAGAERRQKVAQGDSRGTNVKIISSPGGAKESAAPSGAWFDSTRNPTACAMGYRLPLLRSFQPDISPASFQSVHK